MLKTSNTISTHPYTKEIIQAYYTLLSPHFSSILFLVDLIGDLAFTINAFHPKQHLFPLSSDGTRISY